MAIACGIMLATFFIDFPYIASYWGLLICPIYIVFIITLASLSK
jgi:NADH:ubiquinone oxidoreductase subunit K